MKLVDLVIMALIFSLDSNSFRTREKSTTMLKAMPAAVVYLDKASSDSKSLEMRQRINLITKRPLSTVKNTPFGPMVEGDNFGFKVGEMVRVTYYPFESGKVVGFVLEDHRSVPHIYCRIVIEDVTSGRQWYGVEGQIEKVK